MLAGHRHDGGRLCVSARLEVVRPQNRVLKKARPFTFFFTPRLTQPLSSRHHRVHDLRSLRRNAHSPTPPQGRCGATGWAGHDAPALQIVGRFSKVHAASIFNPAQNKRGSLQQGPSKIPRIDTQCHDPDDDRAGAASELPWENSHCTVSPTCWQQRTAKRAPICWSRRFWMIRFKMYTWQKVTHAATSLSHAVRFMRFVNAKCVRALSVS